MQPVPEVSLYINPQKSRLFFAGLTSMSCFVLVGSCYLSYSTLKVFKTVRDGGDDTKKSSIKWFFASSTLALTAGAVFAATAWFLPLRTVKKLSYLPKREMIKINVHTPLGSYKDILVPVKDVSCRGDSMSTSQKPLSMKVKGHPLFYLIDLQGTFPSHKLFDMLITNSLK